MRIGTNINRAMLGIRFGYRDGNDLLSIYHMDLHIFRCQDIHADQLGVIDDPPKVLNEPLGIQNIQRMKGFVRQFLNA